MLEYEVWVKSINLYPHRIATAGDIIVELCAMIRRGRTSYRYQANRDDLQWLLSEKTPPEVHVLVGER